jgi:hypothetical protein
LAAGELEVSGWKREVRDEKSEVKKQKHKSEMQNSGRILSESDISEFQDQTSNL